MKESAFQAGLIKELYARYPECLVNKNDAGYRQGFPDLAIYNGEKWAMLECKRSAREKHQPNQDYYVERLGKMGFARFIFPENREETLEELDEYFLGKNR